MAILDDIFSKKENNPAAFPVNDQDLKEAATNMPEIPVTKASDQDNKQPAEIIQTQQAGTPAVSNNTAVADAVQPATVTPPVAGNKWGYNQSEIDALSKAGYTPDKLDYFLSGFDLAKGESFMQRIYEASMPKPAAPDEKQLKRARLLGSIGDSLGLLAQMWSAGKGAHIKERDYKNSASAQIAEKEKSLRALYLQQQNKYNDGMYNARLKDLLRSLDDYNNGKKGIQGVMEAKRKSDQAQTQFEAKQRLAYDKLTQEQANKDADRKIKEDNQKSLNHYRKAMEAQGWSRVADSKNRTAAYVKKMSSGGKSGIQVMIPANPNDPSRTKSELGDNVKVLTITKDEQAYNYREAIKNRNFIKEHPELVLSRPEMEGTKYQKGSYGYAKEDIVAATYAQYLYDKQWADKSENSTPSTGAPVNNYDFRKPFSFGFSYNIPGVNDAVNDDADDTAPEDEYDAPEYEYNINP
ncbi:MAG: hypothetical protein LBL79_02590 [Prevotella sp.]|jgi:hypothetical protein|nr:hypothetical protein [Prevotella sp.]